MTAPPEPPRIGVRIAGVGSALPETRLTNADLERMMDTSDEWIMQRTGIRERRIANRDKGESSVTLGIEAVTKALDDAKLAPTDLDLLICATVTMEMLCPANACRIVTAIGAGQIPAWDLSAACSGFLYGINTAYALVRSGAYRTVALIGSDTITQCARYTNEGRGTAILFGDAAGAAILRATDDMSLGVIAQVMHSDGSGWQDLYMPQRISDLPKGVTPEDKPLGLLHMDGRSVYRFAVKAFPAVIVETLKQASMTADDVDMYICHQSNARILESARERLGLPTEKLFVNIEHYGNTVSASVPLCLDELRRSGRIHEGDRIMFVAFGGGLTWGTSLWQI